ncbi:PP2C family protein-serine/threonine phosphatase [Singulisphaera rosea]
MTSKASPREGAAMHCMEIRGGSHAVQEALSMPGLEAWVYSLPYEGAARGGDIHYLSVCGGGMTSRLIVADVSGHGSQVADFSATLRDLMRKNINTKSQTRLVRSLNQQFTEFAQWQRFATAVIATYLANKKTLTVCNAGHPRPLWYHAKAGTWGLMDRNVGEAGNLPLGFDDETNYHQFSVTLGQGDAVFFYTDALIEATTPSGAMLGEEGLLNLARGLDLSDPHRMGPTLLARVEDYRGGRSADDDTTLVALFHTGDGVRPPSLGEKLDVYAKVFGLKSV